MPNSPNGVVSPYQPPPVAPQPAAPSPLPSYADYVKLLSDAAAAHEKAYPTGLLSWLTGTGHDAAVAAAAASAPAAYQHLLAGRNSIQAGGLDLAQTLAFMNRFRQAQGQPPLTLSDTGAVAPAGGPQGAPGGATPPGVAPLAQSPSAALPGAPAVPSPPPSVPGAGPAPDLRALYSGLAASMGNPAAALDTFLARVGAPPASAPLGMPATGAAGPAMPRPQVAAPPVLPGGAPAFVPPIPGAAPAAAPPQAAPAPAVNPAQALRARYASISASMAGLPKYLPSALEYSRLAQAGAPASTIVLPTGQVADGITGQVISKDVNSYLAERAGKAAGAQANAQLPAHLIEQNNQAGNQRETNREQVENEAKNRFSTIVINGQNVPVSDYDLGKLQEAGGLGANGVTRGFAANPFRDTQIKQVTDAQKVAGDAVQQQNAVQQLGAALKTFHTTGPLGPAYLDILRHLDQADLLTPEMSRKVAAGEFAAMSANSIVAAIAKQAAAGRVPVGIYQQVAKTKPGLASAEPELMVEALNQDFQRMQDYARFAADYYSKNENATRLDAQSAFEKAYPIALYQSRVLPLPAPARAADRRIGYTYKNRAGVVARWNGQTYEVVQ